MQLQWYTIIKTILLIFCFWLDNALQWVKNKSWCLSLPYLHPWVQTTNYGFLSTDIPSTNLQVIEGIIRALLQKQCITDTREGLSTKLFFSDREKLQNRNDRQLLLEILIKAWIRNSRSGQVAAAPIWPAAIAPQGPVPGNILWKGPSCPCLLFNLALYMG